MALLLLPLSLPAWKAGTFFSSSSVESRAEFDFLGLYLPTNPFYSLANNVVPAVVVFSILFGVALIGVAAAQRSPRVAVWFWQARPGGPTERPTGTTEAK